MSKLSSLVSGVQWGAVSIATITTFQLIFMAVMARLLDPSDFGLVAIANVALRFYSYFSQMGIAPALIQKPVLDDGDIRAALALSLGVSSLFFVLAVATAGMVERFFGMSSLALVMQILAFNFIVSGFSAVSLGLIRRSRNFKVLAVIEIVSYVIGYGIVGITAASLGSGVWALVVATLTQILLTAIMAYAFIRHPLGLGHGSEERRHFIGYGGRYSIIGFIEFLTSNIDSLIVGKLMGAATAGYYNRSQLLANLPVQQPTKVLTQALFPVMSSISDQHDKQSISVQLGVLLVGCYAFSVGLGISVAATDIVLVMLGEKWVDSIPVLQVLAYSVGPIYVSNIIGVTLDSMGRLSTKLRIQLFIFVILVALLAALAPSGDAVSVAIAVVSAFWIRLLVMGWVVIRLLQIPLGSVLRIVTGLVVVASTTGIMILFVSHLAGPEMSHVLRLVAEIVAGALGFALGLYILRFVVSRHPAVIYLATRMPAVSRLMQL